MRLRRAIGGNGNRGRGLRRWWLGLVLAACLAWAAPAQAQPFVYVTTGGESASGSVSQFDASGGALSPLSPASVAAGPFPFLVAVAPDGKSVYVTDSGADSISQYDVGAGGTLTPKSPVTVPSGHGPDGIAVSPDGKSAYVTNAGDNSVSQYNVDPVTGVLSPKTPATVPAGSDPITVAVTPNGKSAYVANNLSGVSQYNVDPVTGVLSPKTPATVPAGNPVDVVITPDGRSAYVTNRGAGMIAFGAIFQYDIDPVTGALSPKTPALVDHTARGGFMAVTPDGRSAYHVGGNPFGTSFTVEQYDIDPVTGVLSPKTPATVGAGANPGDVAVAPDGKSAYVTNSIANTVSQYDIDPSSGALSPKTPAMVATSAGPGFIAVTPLPRAHSTATSVSCSPSVFVPGDVAVCTATVTDTAGGATTTPTGTVSFANSGAGGFLGSPCTLSGSGASASCAVFFGSFPRGGQGITANYGGDAAHSASAGTTIVLIAAPASTDGCVVFGHGRITAANGDRASFRGLAAATPPAGVEFYRDNGPANALRVRSLSADAVTCSTDATKATIFGQAEVNGAGSVEYRVDVQLTAWEWGKDTYRIRLANGYDSGAQQVRHGDVEIRIRDAEHHHHDRNADHYKPGAGPDGG